MMKVKKIISKKKHIVLLILKDCKELKVEAQSKSEREKEVNVLRLSQNIKKNILKELNQITYNEKAEKEDEKSDYKLINKDQEVDLGEDKEEGEDEENNENGNLEEQPEDSGQDG
jgi:hypothetical protein